MKHSCLTTRRFVMSCLPACLLAMSLPGALRAEEAEAGSIFNGKDLTGWKVPSPNPFWTVVDGVMTGTSDPAKKGNMLYTEKSYADCELEAEARWTGDIDSGFMLRKPEIQMQIGVSRSLKVDMTGCFYIGNYPEAGQAKERATLLKPGDWNHFKFRAKGDTFTIFINGTEAVTYQNPKYAGPGPIGLQIHGGVEMKIEFRNLKVKELK